MPSTLTVGIDLGGTNIKGAVCDADHRPLAQRSVPTDATGDAEQVLGRMADLARDVIARAGATPRDILGVGVGAPGPISHARGVILDAPNVPGFRNVAVRDRMQALTGIQTTLENDANAAAYGEFVAGAGRAAGDMVMFTLGTGVGGGIVIGGRLLRGEFDNAGELGHTIIVPDGRECPCGQRGCLERYASAAAVAIRLAEAVRTGEPCVLEDRVLAGDELDARDVLKAIDAGDALAARIWDETCFYLAVAIVNVQHTLNPRRVVLAGGLVNAKERLLSPVRAHFERLSWRIAPDRPEIALAALGADAGVIGAAALAVAEFGPRP